VDRHANAFFLEPGCCYRLVCGSGGKLGNPITALRRHSGGWETQPVSPVPQPGDRYAQAFTVGPNQCWALIHDRQGKPAHCAETPSWIGRWFSPRHDGTYWRVWSCEAHTEGLTGLRGVWVAARLS
jgi:hypothetical protein